MSNNVDMKISDSQSHTRNQGTKLHGKTEEPKPNETAKDACKRNITEMNTKEDKISFCRDCDLATFQCWMETSAYLSIDQAGMFILSSR